MLSVINMFSRARYEKNKYISFKLKRPKKRSKSMAIIPYHRYTYNDKEHNRVSQSMQKVFNF